MGKKQDMPSGSSRRLDSLDAFRGFDMIWIMGAPALVWGLNTLLGGGVLGWLSEQMHHAAWHGLRWMDMVFPTFLFIAGCSFPFSLAARRRRGEPHSRIYRHIFTRAAWLVFLGLIYNGLLNFDFANMRYASVLGRIGLSWMGASVLFMHLSHTKWRIAVPFGLLLGYSLLIGLVPAPDAPAGSGIYTQDGSLVGWVDRMLLPGKMYMGNFDPEGLLAIIPAVGTALLGMLVGEVLQHRASRKEGQTLLMLGVAGVGLLLLGVLWGLVEPVNKALWTSAFALQAAGISTLCLLLFYWVIDVKGWRGWAFFFKVIGVNSLVIYLGQGIINFYGIGKYFLGGLASFFSEDVASLILSVGYVAACWLFLYFLYRQKIFLKV